MACGMELRTVVFSTEPWLLPTFSNRFPPVGPSKTHQLKMGSCFRTSQTHNFQRLSCSSQDDQGPPQEAVLKAISEVSKTEGRVGHTTNVVIGGTVTDDSTNEWLNLDQKVNSYPTVRRFTAIGTGGDDFVHSMVVAVESVLQQPIPEGYPEFSQTGKTQKLHPWRSTSQLNLIIVFWITLELQELTST